MNIIRFGLVAAAVLSLAACQKAGTANVDGKRIAEADANAEWLSYGKGYSEQRFSPLDKVNTGNVGRLGLAWYAQFDTDRGQEATPLMVDGVLYTSTAWSKVYAFDAKTGELLGAHMVGAEVTELIQGYTVAKTMETTEKELMETVFPHPTLSEMMHESVLDAYGRAIHF